MQNNINIAPVNAFRPLTNTYFKVKLRPLKMALPLRYPYFIDHKIKRKQVEYQI